MFKIAGTSGSPPHWPKALFDLQRPTCTAALQGEIGQLRDSLIVVTSVYDYGILHNVAGAQGPWDKQPRPGKTYFTHDPVAGNTFVHCYHPRYMRQQKFFDAAVTEVIRFSRETLAPF